MLTDRAMFDFSCIGEDPMTKSCDREWTDEGWWCMNDHTGCLWNDGHNTCNHHGDSRSPLEDE